MSGRMAALVPPASPEAVWMRICYVSHSYDHFTAPYVNWFVSRGHEVHLVSCYHEDLPNVINHHPWKGEFDPQKATWAYFLMIPRVRRMIRRIAPDVLHSHYVTSNGLLAAASGVRPLVVTAHGSDIHYSIDDPIRRRAIMFAMSRADLVNPVSRGLEAKIIALGVPASKVACFTLGVETSRYRIDRSHRRPGPVRFVCTRRLEPIYQCDMIIRACELLARRRDDFRLLFAGRGVLESRLREEVDRRQLGEFITFRGGYQMDELPAILADADIYISASRSDGTSLCLLEAMAAGLFPVVSDIAANREWLTGEGDSLLFDCSSDLQLADRLERAVIDTDLRLRALMYNRERVVTEGDRDVNMSKLAAHYERLCSRSDAALRG